MKVVIHVILQERIIFDARQLQDFLCSLSGSLPFFTGLLDIEKYLIVIDKCHGRVDLSGKCIRLFYQFLDF